MTCGKLDTDDVAVRCVNLSGEARLDWLIETKAKHLSAKLVLVFRLHA